MNRLLAQICLIFIVQIYFCVFYDFTENIRSFTFLTFKEDIIKGKVKGKGKVFPYRPGVAQRVSTGIALLFHDCGTRKGKWSAARSGRTLPPGKTRYPFYRRLGGPKGRSGRAENLVATGTRSRTVQPVVSRYTD